MKKSFFVIAIAILAGGFVSCNKQQKVVNGFGDEQANVVSGTIQNSGEIEHAVATDRQEMYAVTQEKAGEYVYYETTIEMTDFLDADTVPAVKNCVNVMQSMVECEEGGYRTDVYEFKHNFLASTTDVELHEDAFWCEDCDLSSYGNRIIPFAVALDRVLKSNFKKPHSAFVVLRKPLWKVEVNPLYIFGNPRSGMLYVDALSGEVTDVFPGL